MSRWGTFDTVLSAEVVEHLFLPRELFARAREALGDGGRLVVTTPYHGYAKNLALAVFGQFDQHWVPLSDYGHIKFFSKATLGGAGPRVRLRAGPLATARPRRAGGGDDGYDRGAAAAGELTADGDAVELDDAQVGVAGDREETGDREAVGSQRLE